MQFFKRLCLSIKLKFLHFYQKIKVNRRWFYIFIFLILFIPNVKADEMIFGANGSIRIYNGNTTYVNVNSSANNLPKVIYGLVGSGSLNLGVLDLTLSPASGNINALDNSYNYLIFDTCLTGNISIVITNNGCANSCVATGTYQSIKLSTSCTTGGNTGNRYLIQVPVQKWYLNEVSETLEAASFITVSNNTGYAIPITINQVFLSNEDYVVTYANQQELINKLNSVQTAITNMQNSINSNANTNTQSIINNQNTNAAQAHTDAQNIKNSVDSIKNQDHTYNNNASDTVPNSSDINSVLQDQNTLSSQLDLDSSILDIQLNTDATSWIWGIVNNIRTVNGKITLLFTTILSLAIIKMILNR